MANFLLLLGKRLSGQVTAYRNRVADDGGTLESVDHAQDVWDDVRGSIEDLTLVNSCDGGGSTAQNFAVGSEDISNATYWQVSGVTATSDVELNPFGGSGVSLVAETASSTAKGFFQQSGYQASIVTGQAYTISAYVKKGDGVLAPDIIQVTYLSSGFGTDFYANYNISTGVVSKVNGGFADIEDIGGGWYRISLAGVATATGALGTFVLAFVNNDSNATRLPAYAGNTSRDVYVWGVQFVQGNEPGQYIKTTTAAINSVGTLYSLYVEKHPYYSAYVDRIVDDSGTENRLANLYTFADALIDNNLEDDALLWLSASAGKATVLYRHKAFTDVDTHETRVTTDSGTVASAGNNARVAQDLLSDSLYFSASVIVPCASGKATVLYSLIPN